MAQSLDHSFGRVWWIQFLILSIVELAIIIIVIMLVQPVDHTRNPNIHTVRHVIIFYLICYGVLNSAAFVQCAISERKARYRSKNFVFCTLFEVSMANCFAFIQLLYPLLMIWYFEGNVTCLAEKDDVYMVYTILLCLFGLRNLTFKKFQKRFLLISDSSQKPAIPIKDQDIEGLAQEPSPQIPMEDLNHGSINEVSQPLEIPPINEDIATNFSAIKGQLEGDLLTSNSNSGTAVGLRENSTPVLPPLDELENLPEKTENLTNKLRRFFPFKRSDYKVKRLRERPLNDKTINVNFSPITNQLDMHFIGITPPNTISSIEQISTSEISTRDRRKNLKRNIPISDWQKTIHEKLNAEICDDNSSRLKTLQEKDYHGKIRNPQELLPRMPDSPNLSQTRFSSINDIEASPESASKINYAQQNFYSIPKDCLLQQYTPRDKTENFSTLGENYLKGKGLGGIVQTIPNVSLSQAVQRSHLEDPEEPIYESVFEEKGQLPTVSSPLNVSASQVDQKSQDHNYENILECKSVRPKVRSPTDVPLLQDNQRGDLEDCGKRVYESIPEVIYAEPILFPTKSLPEYSPRIYLEEFRENFAQRTPQGEVQRSNVCSPPEISCLPQYTRRDQPQGYKDNLSESRLQMKGTGSRICIPQSTRERWLEEARPKKYSPPKEFPRTLFGTNNTRTLSSRPLETYEMKFFSKNNPRSTHPRSNKRSIYDFCKNKFYSRRQYKLQNSSGKNLQGKVAQPNLDSTSSSFISGEQEKLIAPITGISPTKKNARTLQEYSIKYQSAVSYQPVEFHKITERSPQGKRDVQKISSSPQESLMDQFEPAETTTFFSISEKSHQRNASKIHSKPEFSPGIIQVSKIKTFTPISERVREIQPGFSVPLMDSSHFSKPIPDRGLHSTKTNLKNPIKEPNDCVIEMSERKTS